MPYPNHQTREIDHDRMTDLRQGAELARHPGWRKFGVAAVLGAGIGLGAGLLLAPASGATVRGKVRNAASRAKSKIHLPGRGNGVKDLAEDTTSSLKQGRQDMGARRADGMADRATR